MESKEKAAALELIKQLIELEKVKDKDYSRLLAEKKIYQRGESIILFHLKSLQELVEKI